MKEADISAAAVIDVVFPLACVAFGACMYFGLRRGFHD